jgi:hypothetical protein
VPVRPRGAAYALLQVAVEASLVLLLVERSVPGCGTEDRIAGWAHGGDRQDRDEIRQVESVVDVDLVGGFVEAEFAGVLGEGVGDPGASAFAAREGVPGVAGPAGQAGLMTGSVQVAVSAMRSPRPRKSRISVPWSRETACLGADFRVPIGCGRRRCAGSPRRRAALCPRCCSRSRRGR